MRPESDWSESFKRAVHDDVLSLNGSDPMPPPSAIAVFRNWGRLDAFDRALQTLQHDSGDGALQDARQAYRALDWAAVLFTPAIEAWLRDVITVRFPAVDWS